jgi:hypothetical protein
LHWIVAPQPLQILLRRAASLLTTKPRVR